jgi:tetraacyldisaccharide-1-P 4'-kinase
MKKKMILFNLFDIFWFERLPVPVISVGNLTWGGNGKTPMVEFIARWLSDSGISPLILTRVLLLFVFNIVILCFEI